MGCSGNHYHLWLILAQLLTILLTTDGSITWYEPPPIQTVPDVTNPVVTHKPNNTMLREGSINASLSWNFSLSDVTFSSLAIFFDSTTIAGVRSNGLYGVEPGFEEKFVFRWISLQRATLIIFNVTTAETGGLYSCQVLANKGFGSFSWRSEVQVDVVFPSSITNVSSNQNVTEGNNVTLTCTRDGNPEPAITWTRLSDNIIVVMPLINISRQENGTYRCTADNGVGSPATEDVSINVQYAPGNVMLNSLSDKVCVGNMVEFTCKAGAANPEVERYTLYQNTVIANMSSSGVSKRRLNTIGIFSYKCEAENEVGRGTSSRISVTVEGNFSVASVSPKTVVKEGDNVVLSCNVTGNPAPKVVWVYARDDEVYNGSTWTLPNITKARNGTYSCLASNACGRDNKTTTIVVQYAPENVMLNSSSDKVVEGNMVQFTCKAGAANPQVERYTLYLNNNVMANMGSSGVSTLSLNTTGIFSYKCEADNSVGNGTSNSISITVEDLELKDVHVTCGVTNKDCKVPSDVVQVKQEFPDEVYSEGKSHFPHLKSVKVNDTRCGSVIVDLVLRFSQSVSKNDVISFLKDAARNGNFGQFTVDPDSVKLTSTVKVFPSEPTKGTPPCKKSFLQNDDCSVNWLHLILIIVVAVVLIIIIAAAGGCWIHKKRKCRKDTRIACDPGSEEQRLQRDDPYAQVNNGYAETGPRSVNSREKGAAAVPDYAVVDKSAKKKKKQDEEKPPDYAVVDKSKKTKKNEKGDDTYAKVDMSKKTSKKKRKPGEDTLYADLGDFNGASQMPTVATSPKAQAQLPPIKRPEPYEGTQYADITQFLKGDATLPIDDKQGGQQGAELKEKEGKTDGAGGENAPKETPM